MYTPSASDGAIGTHERGRTAERSTAADREYSPSKRKGRKKSANLRNALLALILSTASFGALLFVSQRPAAKSIEPASDAEKSSSSAIAAQQVLSSRTLADHAEELEASPRKQEQPPPNPQQNESAEIAPGGKELNGHELLKSSLEKEFKSSLKKAKRQKKRNENAAKMLRSMFPDGHVPDVPGVDHEITHRLEDHMNGNYPELPVLEMEQKLKEGSVTA